MRTGALNSNGTAGSVGNRMLGSLASLILVCAVGAQPAPAAPGATVRVRQAPPSLHRVSDLYGLTPELSPQVVGACTFNVAPVAVAGVDRVGTSAVAAGQPQVFDAGASYDSDGELVSYQWYFSDDGSVSYDEQAVHTFATTGTYAVTLTVWDNCGATGVDQATVEVTGGSGMPSAVLTIYNSQPGDVPLSAVDLGLYLTFDATQSTAAYYYIVDFGDGTYNTDILSPYAVHAYTQPGSYLAVLTVFDASGTYSDSAEVPLHVLSTMSLLGVGPTVGQSASDMVVDANNVAWVTHDQQKLSAFNVSSPTNMVQLGRWDLPCSLAIATGNNLLYLACNLDGVRTYQANTAGPTWLSTYNTRAQDGQMALDLAAAGKLAYLAAGPAGLKVLDMTAPASPRLVGSVLLPGGAYATKIAVAGGVAYVADTSGRVYTISVAAINPNSPPQNPVSLVVAHTISDAGFVSSLTARADGLLAFGGVGGLKLYSVNVSNPASVTHRCTFNLSQDTGGRLPSGMSFVGSNLYAGFSPEVGFSMRVGRLNVADPCVPYTMEFLLISAGQAGGNITSPQLVGGYVCWKNEYADVLAVDVAGP